MYKSPFTDLVCVLCHKKYLTTVGSRNGLCPACKRERERRVAADERRALLNTIAQYAAVFGCGTMIGGLGKVMGLF